jgi:hypothetical protein
VSPVSCKQYAARRKNSGSFGDFKHNNLAVSDAAFHAFRSISAASFNSSADRFILDSGGNETNSTIASSANPNSNHPLAARNVLLTSIRARLPNHPAVAIIRYTKIQKKRRGPFPVRTSQMHIPPKVAPVCFHRFQITSPRM